MIQKINLSIITYILSLFLLLTALNAVDFNIEFHHYLDFSFIHFFYLGECCSTLCQYLSL